MRQVCEYEQCFGCGACYNICLKNAISLGYDDWGNLIPRIDQDKCVDCNMCKKVCPAIQKSCFKMPEAAYAAITKNEYDYASTSSGGIATAFSKHILYDKGIVYGASFVNGSAEVKHIRVDSLPDLEALKGSKYVQSNIGHVPKSVKQDLDSGRKVIFIGTPCQIDGLQLFLKKNYENLITVNFVCHGVPSNRLFCEHVQQIFDESQGLKIRFRLQNKFQLTIEKGSKSKSVPFYKDNYFLGFMRKLFYRNVCYQCKYAQPKRVGDLTIGDFWGFDSKKTFPAEHSKGLSLVLINTKKGHDFFETVKDELIFQKREVKEAIAGNPQLNYPSKRNVFFYRFRRLYLKYGFEKASKRILWPYKIAYNINYIIQRISKGIKDKKNI